jgi:hypothetical protein
MLRRFLSLVLFAALTACAVQPGVELPTATIIPVVPPATLTPMLPTPEPTLLPETQVDQDLTRVFVDLNRPQQTLGSVAGGNFVHQISQTMTAFEPVAEYNLNHLQVGSVRVRIALEVWEPQNDNADPLSADPPAFFDSGANHATFLFLQEMHQRGVLLVATAWDIPDWLAFNPDIDRNKYLPPERYPEAVESLAQWLLTARDVYGVEVDYISFNETDVGANVSMSGREYADFVAAARPRFAELGLKTRWLLADSANMSNGLGRARTAWNRTELRPYLGPLAVHSWDADAPDETLLALRTFAQAEGLEVWCTEAGWDAFLWNRPEEFSKWPHALNLARIYSRLLKLSGATNILYWEMLGFDYNLNDGQAGFPAFEILRQLSERLPAGTRILETSANTETLVFLAAQAGEKTLVYLVNMAGEPQTVQVNGLPEGDYALEVSTAQALDAVAGPLRSAAGSLTLELPPESVSILFP